MDNFEDRYVESYGETKDSFLIYNQLVPLCKNHKRQLYLLPESVKFMIFDNQLAYCKLV